MSKLLYLLTLIGAIASFGNGSQESNGINFQPMELDSDVWRNVPLTESKNARRLGGSGSHPNIVDFIFYEPPPKILQTLLPMVRDELNSLIVTRVEIEITTKLNISRLCMLDTQEDVFLPAENLQTIPVFVGTMPSDGLGGVVASASGCSTATLGSIRRIVLGRLRYDPADIHDQQVNLELVKRILLHELLHVLGFGFISKQFTANGEDGPWYMGPKAVAEYVKLLPPGDPRADNGLIPLEDIGPKGTYGSHWRSSVFGDEIMTGVANTTSRLLSKMTATVLEEIGWEVNYKSPTINPYVLPEFRKVKGKKK